MICAQVPSRTCLSKGAWAGGRELGGLGQGPGDCCGRQGFSWSPLLQQDQADSRVCPC